MWDIYIYIYKYIYIKYCSIIKKEWKFAIHSNMDGLGESYAKWRSSLVGICLQCRKSRFWSLVGKIPWRKEWLPTPVFLPEESHGQGSLVDYSSWCRRELDTTEWLSHTVHTYTLSEINQTKTHTIWYHLLCRIKKTRQTSKHNRKGDSQRTN